MPTKGPASPADLGQFNLFSDLSSELLEAAYAKMAVREAAVGEHWMPTEMRLMLVWSGYVRLTRLSPVGQPITLRSARAGDTLGAAGLFGDARPEKYQFLVDLPSCILSFGAAEVTELTRLEPELLRRLTKAVSREAIILADRLFELHTMDGLSRLKLELLRLCDRGGVTRTGLVAIRPAPTHEALASRIGVTREVVTRHMKVLRLQGVLTANRGEIVILDRERLEALVAIQRG